MPPKKTTSPAKNIKPKTVRSKAGQVEEVSLIAPEPAPVLAAPIARSETKGSGTTAKPPAPAAPKVITHEMISKRAHELWIAGGCRNGFAAQDWAEAERQLKAGL